jgi:hypothetical protein
VTAKESGIIQEPKKQVVEKQTVFGDCQARRIWHVPTMPEWSISRPEEYAMKHG